MYRKNLDMAAPAMPFVWLTTIASLYEFIVSYVFEYNASIWFQLYSFTVFIALLYFFQRAIEFKTYHLSIGIMIGFIITYTASFFFWNKNDFLISTAINNTYLTIVVIILSIIWLKNKFEKLESYNSFSKSDAFNLWDNEEFYLIVGLFVYYCTTIFLYLSSNIIFNSELYFFDYWLVNIIATLFLRLSLTLSTWKMRKV